MYKYKITKRQETTNRTQMLSMFEATLSNLIRENDYSRARYPLLIGKSVVYLFDYDVCVFPIVFALLIA